MEIGAARQEVAEGDLHVPTTSEVQTDGTVSELRSIHEPEGHSRRSLCGLNDTSAHAFQALAAL